MSKRATIFVVVGILLFTFGVAPPAHAIVPVVAWVVWSVVVGAGSVAAVSEKKSDHGQAEAKDQRQKDGKGMTNTASQLQESPG
jgi:hypothetical protein